MDIRTWQRRQRAGAEPLFTFAVVADTHMNPEDDVASSPWEVNKLANDRSKAVVEEVNSHRPDFVVHLGDMIHPVPSHADYPVAAERFHALFGQLTMPLHVVPGNHDVGDKPLDWTPAAIVTEEYVELYEEHFGKSYYSFAYGDCEFIVLNAQIINSGFDSEAAQRKWLEETLAARPDARRFLFLHYPPYVLSEDEPGHYDNLDEPGRSWLLELLRHYRVEAFFAGHVHNFFYDRVGTSDFYVLPSTSFVRSDYSEFARVAPADDFHGRNDVPKLGYFLVQVWEDGHRPVVCRTYGRTTDSVDLSAEPDRVLPAGPRIPVATTVGVDLRHPWAEIVQIPYTGCLDEFSRKEARNDYPLLALWEMGITNVRVPVADFTDAATLARARILAANGTRFMPFVYGLPTQAEQDVLVGAREIISGVEIIVHGDLVSAKDRIADLKAAVDVPILLSTFHGHDDNAGHSGKFLHVVNHGFLLDELDRLEAELDGLGHGFPDGVVFRVSRDNDPVAAVRRITEVAGALGTRAIAHVRLAGDNPAVPIADELSAANRVAATMVAAIASPEVELFVDTLLDQDRGYFPRTGLIDRQFNLNLAGNTMRNLNTVLNPRAFVNRLPVENGIDGYVLSGAAGWQILLLPDVDQKVARLDLGIELPKGAHHAVMIVDLGDGLIQSVPFTLTETGLTFDCPLAVSRPMLLDISV